MDRPYVGSAMSHRIDPEGMTETIRRTAGWRFALATALFGILTCEALVAQATESNVSSSSDKSSESEAVIRTMSHFIDHGNLSGFERFVQGHRVENKTLEYFFYKYLYVVGDNTGNGEEAVLVSLFHYLKERGVNTDPHYIMGSPLLNAISHRYFGLAELLILNGADVNAKGRVTAQSPEGSITPLKAAEASGNKKLVAYLISKGSKQ